MNNEEFSELLRREKAKRDRMWDPAATVADDSRDDRLGRRAKTGAAQFKGRMPGRAAQVDGKDEVSR